jgi:tRNA (mo5U34)-methyltransferase
MEMKGNMDKAKAEKLVKGQAHWHHAFEVFPGVRTPGTYDPGFLLEKLRLPADLRGTRILEIGPSDGYFTLQLARRGAAVTCIDYRRKDEHGFGVMEKISGLQFDYHHANVYDVTEERFGQFDIVLFLGVLYHLPDMVKALSLLRAVCTGAMYMETACAVDLAPGQAVAQYFEGNTLNGDYSNFWMPNVECVRAMCRDAGFAPVRDETWGNRMFLQAQAVPRPLKHQWAYGTLG